MGEWKFVTSHALVLVYLAKHPQMTARELSNSIGITERAVRKIIADLEAEGYFRKEKEGRRVRYHINPKLPFRHHTQKDKAIEKLLGALGWKEKKKAKNDVKRRMELLKK
jgi:DNA-binding MarR family transcriptional regulator